MPWSSSRARPCFVIWLHCYPLCLEQFGVCTFLPVRVPPQPPRCIYLAHLITRRSFFFSFSHIYNPLYTVLFSLSLRHIVHTSPQHTGASCSSHLFHIYPESWILVALPMSPLSCHPKVLFLLSLIIYIYWKKLSASLIVTREILLYYVYTRYSITIIVMMMLSFISSKVDNNCVFLKRMIELKRYNDATCHSRALIEFSRFIDSTRICTCGFFLFLLFPRLCCAPFILFLSTHVVDVIMHISHRY